MHTVIDLGLGLIRLCTSPTSSSVTPLLDLLLFANCLFVFFFSCVTASSSLISSSLTVPVGFLLFGALDFWSSGYTSKNTSQNSHGACNCKPCMKSRNIPTFSCYHHEITHLFMLPSLMIAPSRLIEILKFWSHWSSFPL